MMMTIIFLPHHPTTAFLVFLDGLPSVLPSNTINASYLAVPHATCPKHGNFGFATYAVCLFVYCVWQFKELDKTLQI